MHFDSEAHPVSVSVCICTYQRLEPLSRLLERLEGVAKVAPDKIKVSVCVADDDPAFSAREICSVDRKTTITSVSYLPVGSQNISTARNASLAVGLVKSDFVAFIDDDCLPDVSWLVELVATASLTQADIVSGYCIDIPDARAPGWLKSEGFLTSTDDLVDGQPITIGALKNTLVRADWLRKNPVVRFDPALGKIGGEDVQFFASAQRCNAVHRFSRSAIVQEVLPLNRSTMKYQLRRAFWYGNSEAVTSIMSKSFGRFRLLASGGKLIATSVGQTVAALAHRRPVRSRFRLSQILRGVGKILGTCGIKVSHN